MGFATDDLLTNSVPTATATISSKHTGTQVRHTGKAVANQKGISSHKTTKFLIHTRQSYIFFLNFYAVDHTI